MAPVTGHFTSAPQRIRDIYSRLGRRKKSLIPAKEPSHIATMRLQILWWTTLNWPRLVNVVALCRVIPVAVRICEIHAMDFV
jgi:hypothetical protein